MSNESAQPEKFLTEREAEELLSLRKRSLEYRRHKGIGAPFIKIGNIIRYRKSAVLAWALAQEQK